MSFHTHNNHPEIDICNTTLVGTIQATKAQLIKAFGNPINYYGDRITTEWRLKFSDGQVATIYDWKLCTTPPDETVIAWCIGGMDRTVVPKIHNAFADQLGLCRRLNAA